MARVTYGESITEIAGSVGGVTFLNNPSGPISKLRTNPPVNPSPNQSTYQTNLAKCVAFWPTLSQVNKDLWDAFALAHNHITPWGETKTLSGYQWFISVNLNRLFFHQSITPSPIYWYSFNVPDQFVIQTSSTYIRLYWSTPYGIETNQSLYISLPLRQSSLKLRRSLFFLSSFIMGSPFTYFDFTSDYASFLNVTWSDFYATANCSIIARLKQTDHSSGLSSAFTSAIVKIG